MQCVGRSRAATFQDTIHSKQRANGVWPWANVKFPLTRGGSVGGVSVPQGGTYVPWGNYVPYCTWPGRVFTTI